MSSAFAQASTAPLPAPSRLLFGSFQQDPPQRHTELSRSWQSLAQESKFGSCFAGGLPTPPESRAMTGNSLHGPNPNNLVPQNHFPSSLSYSTYPVSNGVEARSYQYDVERHNHNSGAADRSRPWSGSHEKGGLQASKEPTASESAIASYLQIPPSINDSKGSLAEFAAEITCLFWFESAATLQRAEESSSLNPSAAKPLVPDAFPPMGFLKWVTTILSTTQVTQNVILLALLFIHRLKKFNPGVSGKKGSEYRLLTIALMLGNKFLDDNTYTNKTWAEVSGISVSEIHIMEVEFLSNMRYNLYVSEGEWKRWHVKLARFSVYFNRASKAAALENSKPTPGLTPINQGFPQLLPSPPSPTQLGPPLPMYQPSLPNLMTVAPFMSLSPARRYPEPDHSLAGRKRSMDMSTDLPAAKRFMSTTPSNRSPLVPSPATLGVYTPGSNASSSTLPDVPHNISPMPRLPMPHFPPTSAPTARQHPPLAPLCVPSGSRAMSMVYPNGQTNWSQPVTPGSTVPSSNMNVYSNPHPAMGDLSRRQYASTDLSPTAAAYGNITPSRQSSPSYFLTNRKSPYRPVRGVNTLLIPPPSASFHNPSRNVSLEQMRYQPLTKAPTEPRAGVVPYIHHGAWPQPWTAAPGMPSQYSFHA